MFLAGGTDDSRANALNMYNAGQIGSGGAPVGSTSTIVEQESNPELQEARLQNLTEQQQLLLQQQQQVENQAVQEAAENEMINEQQLLQADAERQNTLNTAEQATSSLSGMTLSGAPAKAPMSGFSLGADNLTANLGTNTVTSSGLSTIPSATTTVPVGTMPGTGFKAGLVDIGQGLGKFAKTGAGIGTIASLAGAGIKRLSDDNDATTLNFGEGAGGVLSSAGQGMALGSMLGPVGTAVGGIGGALWGLGKGLWSRNKARRTERDLEQESNQAQSQNINRFNEDLTSNYGSALSSIRQGELAQKSISGQDLGYNLVARYGGVKKFANGGTDPRLLARQQHAELERQRQLQIENQMLNPMSGIGRLGMKIMQRPRFAESAAPAVQRGGGMRMGMPRYGYAV